MEVANRVCTTDFSSTSGSRMVRSASSVTGVPGVATIAVVMRSRPRSEVRTSMTSVVVPDRVITSTAS